MYTRIYCAGGMPAGRVYLVAVVYAAVTATVVKTVAQLRSDK